MNNDEKAFLLGLEKLTRETGVAIGGCACCGSPYLSVLDDMPEGAGYGLGDEGSITWIEPGDNYDYREYGETIVTEDKGL